MKRNLSLRESLRKWLSARCWSMTHCSFVASDDDDERELRPSKAKKRYIDPVLPIIKNKPTNVLSELKCVW